MAKKPRMEAKPKPTPKKVKTVVAVEVVKEPSKRKFNGLRTEVKYGHITAKEALARLEKIKKQGGFVQESILNWCKRRASV